MLDLTVLSVWHVTSTLVRDLSLSGRVCGSSSVWLCNLCLCYLCFCFFYHCLNILLPFMVK